VRYAVYRAGSGSNLPPTSGAESEGSTVLADMHHEYLLRVRTTDDGYSASCRQCAGTAHPEVRATLGPVSWGQGATAAAAMVSAIAEHHISQIREVPSHGG
jgi:hypothetical protein